MAGRQITPHFNESELVCSHCGRMLFSDRAVQFLEELRVRVGAPLRVNSGYRCPEHNASISSTGLDGPHTVTINDNITVDLGVYGGLAYRVLAEAPALGFTGIGMKQHGPLVERFVHLDRLSGRPDRPRPWPWTY